VYTIPIYLALHCTRPVIYTLACTMHLLIGVFLYVMVYALMSVVLDKLAPQRMNFVFVRMHDSRILGHWLIVCCLVWQCNIYIDCKNYIFSIAYIYYYIYICYILSVYIYLFKIKHYHSLPIFFDRHIILNCLCQTCR
jgi:hypothetical protein